jgi:hypothetical protein
MLRSVPNPSDGPMMEIIARLQKEERRVVQERRTVNRTPFMRPVRIRVLGNEENEFLGYSKNISPVGIGLILQNEFPAGTIARLSIHSLLNRPVHIHGELRWSEPFGVGWFLTGWKLLAESKS